jgi:two-component system, OmpR family, copper resistance phosphate regulon response regulator CusR
MKILLIEDEEKTAKAVQAYLKECQMEVICAFDGATGRTFALENSFDIIISDVTMPYLDGLALCRELRASGNKTPFLFLSALSETNDKILGLEAGADDYLAKPFDFKELRARIDALARRAGKAAVAAPPANKLFFADLEMNLETLEVTRSGHKIMLTPREFALLEFLVRNPGRVISKTEILERVWNIDEKINTNVIEVYVSYVRNKVDKGFDKKLIRTHFGAGYILKKDD